jgi:hypothetical protein
MKRRDFLAAGCLAGLASTSPMAFAAAGQPGAKKQVYELRLCLMETAEQQEATIKFLGDALIPALGRLGIGPVGVFTMAEEESPNLYILSPHDSLETLVSWVHRLGEDEAFLEAGAAFLDAPKDNPAYTRMESSLLLAFDEMPRLEVPSTKDTRVFQLRIYESHSIKMGQRKIEMFNAGGEIAIFRRSGMTPVFFGEALVGNRLPNLTYMLGFDDRESGEKAWETFKSDPGWEKLKNDPYYKDTVSNITNIWLRPAACSQI